MENNPTAAAEAPKAPETEAAPQNTNPEPAQAPAPDMHGFTSDQLADMKKFFDANGGFDKIKSKISNPTPAPEPEKKAEPTPQPQAQPVESQQPLPKGARTNEDLMAEYYFRTLAEKPEYAAISGDIKKGNVLAEMDRLGINYRYPNGAWNDERINEYLKLKAQTVPAKPTAAEPDASAAPTVSYVNVGDKIENIDQAYQVIMQPNHPKSKEAEEFIKSHLNPNSDKKS
ncbi:MAG: hypothetical protein U0L97_02270 [Candidatus Saccharimonadaceae bacterium]|nr:hypothetical protein [Candidatus Saccharimonadaceae bacterium]